MNIEIDKTVLDNNSVVVKRSTPIIPLLLFATAIASFAVALSLNDENGAKMPTLLISFVLVVIGVIKFFVADKSLIYSPTGEILKRHELFFEQKDKENIASLLAKQDMAGIMAKAKSSDNLPIKVDIYTTDSHSITLCRAYQFVPYNFEPITEYQVIKK